MDTIKLNETLKSIPNSNKNKLNTERMNAMHEIVEARVIEAL
jgi:hypothetical protein